jgi:diguanylate cyclase (GGDEF)-like protein
MMAVASKPEETVEESAAPSALAFKRVFMTVTVFLVALALYTTVLIVQRQRALGEVSRYNTTWLTSQAAYEVARLEGAVGAFTVKGSGVDKDNVQLRLDIVLNRVSLLDHGEMADFIKSRPDLQGTVAQFKAAATAAQPLVDTLDQEGVAQKLLAILSPLNTKLAGLSSAAYGVGGTLVARDLHQLGQLHWIVSGVLMVLIACSFGLVGALTWHNRLLQRAHCDVQNLVRNLRRTGNELAAATSQTQEAMAEVQLQNRILQERDHELHTQNTRFDAALNNMSQALCMVDANQRMIVCNVRFLELFGLSQGVIQAGSLIQDVFRAAINSGRHDAALIEDIRAEQETRLRAGQSGSFFQESRDGRALAVSHEPMADGGWVATYEDVTERRRVEARITFMAHHDALTSLPNRRLFRTCVEEALQKMRRSGDGMALLCLDLDHFKTVNDTLGHPAGDILLEMVAQRLQGCIRDTDVVSRLGGDEFAILQSNADQNRAEALAQRIVEAIAEPYDLDGHRAIVSASIGIALTTDSTSSADHLFKNADLALYRAKAGGRSIFCFFEAEMDAELQDRRAIEMDLREALCRQEFEVVYQPQVNLLTDEVSGFEALLRWHHPSRGMVPPVQFIPIAEELGLIGAIGEWVLRQACIDATSWPEHISVSVNLSPVQFRGSDVLQGVKQALNDSGLAPSRLQLEITESALLNGSEKVVATLHQLRDLGLRTVLDDFGTGYSSLSYLRSFPFDKIKIDQSFVREMAHRPDCHAIVNSVANLARKLGMATTAEGIETPQHLDQVRSAGCTEGQGYYFGRPQSLSFVQGYFAAGLQEMNAAE